MHAYPWNPYMPGVCPPLSSKFWCVGSYAMMICVHELAVPMPIRVDACDSQNISIAIYIAIATRV